MITTVFIIRHGIMYKIHEKLDDFHFSQNLLYKKSVIKKPNKDTPESRFKEMVYCQVAIRISGGKHRQVISKITALPMDIPFHTVVKLTTDKVLFSILDFLFDTTTGTISYIFLPQ